MFPQDEVYKVFELGHFFPNTEGGGNPFQSKCVVCGIIRVIDQHGSGPLKGKWDTQWFLPSPVQFLDMYFDKTGPLEKPLTCDEVIVKDILE